MQSSGMLKLFSMMDLSLSQSSSPSFSMSPESGFRVFFCFNDFGTAVVFEVSGLPIGALGTVGDREAVDLSRAGVGLLLRVEEESGVEFKEVG